MSNLLTTGGGKPEEVLTVSVVEGGGGGAGFFFLAIALALLVTKAREDRLPRATPRAPTRGVLVGGFRLRRARSGVVRVEGFLRRRCV